MCDSGSDAGHKVLNLHFPWVLSQSCEIARKDNFSCPFAFRGAYIGKSRKIADGVGSDAPSKPKLAEQRPMGLDKVVHGQVCSKRNAGARTLSGGDDWQAVRRQSGRGVRRPKCQRVCLALTDHEGAKRCAMTGLLVGYACSLYSGLDKLCIKGGA